MIKELKRFRKKILLKQHIMGKLLAQANQPEMRKCLENAIKVVKKHREILELEIKHLSKNAKFKELNLESMTVERSLKKWHKSISLSYQKLKIACVNELNECATLCNQILAYHQTKDDIDEKFIISSEVIDSLKHASKWL